MEACDTFASGDDGARDVFTKDGRVTDVRENAFAERLLEPIHCKYPTVLGFELSVGASSSALRRIFEPCKVEAAVNCAVPSVGSTLVAKSPDVLIEAPTMQGRCS